MHRKGVMRKKWREKTISKKIKQKQQKSSFEGCGEEMGEGATVQKKTIEINYKHNRDT